MKQYPLSNKVALVAGAGADRGIAVNLGAADATASVIGRTAAQRPK